MGASEVCKTSTQLLADNFRYAQSGAAEALCAQTTALRNACHCAGMCGRLTHTHCTAGRIATCAGWLKRSSMQLCPSNTNAHCKNAAPACVPAPALALNACAAACLFGFVAVGSADSAAATCSRHTAPVHSNQPAGIFCRLRHAKKTMPASASNTATQKCQEA